MLKVSHDSMRRFLDTMVPTEGQTLHLFQNDIDVDRNTVLADFVEADYDGYVTQAPSWQAAVQAGAENVALAAALTFAAEPSQATPQNIYGYYFTSATADYSWGETFEDGPIALTMTGNELVIYPQISDKNFDD